MPAMISRVLNSISFDGIALNNKFAVDFTWPKKMPSIAGQYLDEFVDLRCVGVNLAGRTLTSFEETNIYGPVRSVPEGVSYAEDITLTFLETRDLAVRHTFEVWQSMCFNEKDWNLGYYDDFIGDITIYLLTQDGLPSYGITCREAWPKTLNPIPLSMEPTTTAIQTEVSFSFRYWTRVPPEKIVELSEAGTSKLVDNTSE